MDGPTSSVNINPLPLVTRTAAGVSIGGRVVSAGGVGLMSAIVALIDQAGHRREAITSSFGYYTFGDVTAGTAYVLCVSANAWTFDPHFVFVTGEMDDLNFTARP